MRVVTLVLVVGLACAASPAWAMQQKGGQRQAEGSKLIGRLAEHAVSLAKLNPNLSYPESLESSIRRMTRAALATGVWGRLQDYLKSSLNAEFQRLTIGDQEFPESWRIFMKRVASEYWRYEHLLRELSAELLAAGIAQEEIDVSFEWFRSSFAEMGVELVFPNAAYFPDVPEDHWAEPAIHILRRAGVLYGYPDGKYRG